GYTLTFRPFALNAAGVAPIRQRVIDLAVKELESRDLYRAASAAQTLQTALHYPTGTFGREVSVGERERWTPGFVDTLTRLGVLASSRPLDPAIIVAIREALHMHENYGSGETQEAAATAMSKLPQSIEHLLALMVHDGWGNLIRDRG